LKNGWWWAIARVGIFTYPCKDGYIDNGKTDVCVVAPKKVEKKAEKKAEGCVAVFSECGYKGEKLEICDEDPNISYNVKSI